MSTDFQYSVPRLFTAESVGDVIAEELSRHGNGSQQLILVDMLFSVANRNIEGTLILVFEIGRLCAMLEVVLGQQAT